MQVEFRLKNFFPSALHKAAARVPDKAIKTFWDICTFDEKATRKLPPIRTCEGDGSVIKIGKLYQVNVWGNQFLSMFILRDRIDLEPLLIHAKNKNQRKSLTVCLVRRFLQRRPEFDKSCCHVLVLLTAYKVAGEYLKKTEDLSDFLDAFPDLFCTKQDFIKMMIGFSTCTPFSETMEQYSCEAFDTIVNNLRSTK